MSKRAWGLIFAFGCLGLAACNDTDLSFQMGELEPPAECQYSQADEAANAAAQRYSNAEYAAARGDPEAQASLLERRYAKDAAERRKQDAQECEERARELSDLEAQWENAKASNNVARIADAQLTLTVIEIVLLVVTVGGGVASILISRSSLQHATVESGIQATRFREQLDTAYTGMVESRRIAEQQTRAYVLPVAARFRWDEGERPCFEIDYKNAGQTPAINVSECVLFSMDTRPAPYDHSRRYGERPIAGGDTMTATTRIVESLHRSLEVSREIGRLAKDGGSVWVYVYYQDVFGAVFRTGARLDSDEPFREKSVYDLTVSFGGEAVGFFEEIRFDLQGSPIYPEDQQS